MHAIDANQQNVFDFVTFAEFIVGAGWVWLNSAKQSKAERKN